MLERLVFIFATLLFISAPASADFGTAGGGGTGLICFKNDKGEEIVSRLTSNLSQEPTQAVEELRIPIADLKAIDRIELREIIELKHDLASLNDEGFKFVNLEADQAFLQNNLLYAIAQSAPFPANSDQLIPKLEPSDRLLQDLVNVMAILESAFRQVSIIKSQAQEASRRLNPHLLATDRQELTNRVRDGFDGKSATVAQLASVELFLINLKTVVENVFIRMRDSLDDSRQRGLQDFVFLPYVRDNRSGVQFLLSPEDRSRCVVATLVRQDWDGAHPIFDIKHSVYLHPGHSMASRAYTLLHESVYSLFRREAAVSTAPAKAVRKMTRELARNAIDPNVLYGLIRSLKIEPKLQFAQKQ